MATGSKGIRAGRAYVELFADSSKLVRGLRRAEQKLKAFGGHVRGLGLRLAAVGSAITVALGGTIKSFAAMGDKLDKMANRTGISVEALSELAFAAEQSGAGVDIFEKAVGAMQRSIRDAGRGLSTKTEALQDLGLTFKQLQSLTPEEQFKLVAGRVGEMTDATSRAAISMELFGRSGRQLMPMLLDGVAGIEKLQQEARRLGLTMSTKDAKAAAELTDSLNRLWRMVKMGVFHIGSALAAALSGTVKKMTEVIRNTVAWIKQNKGLAVTLAKVALAVMAGGIALVVLGTIISGLGSVFGVLAQGLTGAFTVLKLLITVVAALVSPIGLVITALAGLGVYLLTVSQAGGKAISWLGKKFGLLGKEARAAFGGIGDALAAGDITLAARIMWLSLKLQWQRGVNAIKKIWYQGQSWLVNKWYDLVAGAQFAWHGLEVAWIETISFMKKIWAIFQHLHARVTEKTAGFLAKSWAWLQSKFDDSFDYEFAVAYIDKDVNSSLDKLDKQFDRKLQGIESERARQREQSAQQHEATLAAIEQEAQAKLGEMEKAHAAKLVANEAELAEAKKKWRAAIQAARDKRYGKETSPADADSSLNKAQQLLAGIGDVVTGNLDSVNVTGTFNAFAAGGLGSGSVAERTASATEQTARNTGKLLDEAKHGGLTFA